MILFRTGKTIFLIWGLSAAFAIKVPHQGKKTAVVRLIGRARIMRGFDLYYGNI